MQHTETIKLQYNEIANLLNLAEKLNEHAIELEYTTNLDNEKPPVIAVYNPGGNGNSNVLGFLNCKVVENNRSGNKIYSLCEAIADISINVGHKDFVTVDSRQLISYIISWAKEFETVNAAIEWGVNTELEYIEAIDQFTDIKLRDAIDSGIGYYFDNGNGKQNL
jgi:hypothetical protein